MPVGAVHVYKVPVGTMPFVASTGVTLNITPLHVVAVNGFTVADGFTVTVTVNVAFAPQLSVVGVTVYVAVCATLVGFVNVPVILFDPLPVLPPVINPVTTGALHAYVVPAGTMPFVIFVGVTVKLTPLQVTVVIAVITAVGLIVTVTVNTAPVQVPLVGVTVYVAVLAMFVVFVKFPLIVFTGVP